MSHSSINDPVNHDPFKKLFTFPRMIEDVIRSQVPRWVGRLDFSTLRRVPTESMGDRLEKRYADLTWHAAATDGLCDFLLLLEFPDRPDPHFAFRLDGYAARAAKDLLERRAARGEPRRELQLEKVVLYRGSEPWTDPMAVSPVLPGGGHEV